MTVTQANVGSVIRAAIPELSNDVKENEDLYHLTFWSIFDWTAQAVREGNRGNLVRAIELIDAIFLDCDAYVRNAVTVSFLEYVHPEDKVGREIFDALTPELRRQWHLLGEYLDNLRNRKNV